MVEDVTVELFVLFFASSEVPCWREDMKEPVNRHAALCLVSEVFFFFALVNMGSSICSSGKASPLFFFLPVVPFRSIGYGSSLLAAVAC